jgi:hypothetical protein
LTIRYSIYRNHGDVDSLSLPKIDVDAHDFANDRRSNGCRAVTRRLGEWREKARHEHDSLSEAF